MSPFDQIQMSPLMFRGKSMAEVVQMSLKEADLYAVVGQVIEATQLLFCKFPESGFGLLRICRDQGFIVR